jgi:ABC-2 type transport system permease protein
MKNQYLTLARREFWEHRSLWIAPAAASGFLLLTAMAGVLFSPGRVRVGNLPLDGGPGRDFAGNADKLMLMSTIGIASMMIIVACVVAGVYLLDCLYAERKDRSILFWKSLPVSDAMTVASKAVVALLAVPLIVYLLSLAVSLVVFGVLAIKYSGSELAPLLQWHTLDWLALQGVLLLNILVAALWYAPIAAALLMISAAARRATVLWAVVPPLVLLVVERATLGTDNVWRFLAYRLTGFFDAMGVGFDRPMQASTTEQVERVATLYEKINAAPLLLGVDLWLGVAAAIALLAIAIRLRRWRDDT